MIVAAKVEEEEATARGAVDALVARVVAGHEAAWPELVAEVHGRVVELCRRRRLDGDVGHEVALRAVERLRADDMAALRRYAETCARYPQTRFARWLAVLAAHVMVDVLRAQPGTQRRRDGAARRLVRLEVIGLDEDARERAAGALDPASLVEVRRITARLLADDFPPLQRRAVLMWLEGHPAGTVAAALGLDGPRAAERLLHAARQRLRRHFATGDGS
jgi:hypothetical protein